MITVRLEHSTLKMDDITEYHWAKNFFLLRIHYLTLIRIFLFKNNHLQTPLYLTI